MSEPLVEHTSIPGLVVVRLPVHGDSRGWFKENWQREKMVARGVPDFVPVQNNVSFNATRGVTRGFHAEPWDKYVSVGSGRVFAAWIDLRAENFGQTFFLEMDEKTAVFVPRGVANAFQTLSDNTVYTYLVTQHWRAELSYVSVRLDDPRAAIPWPISLDEAVVSDKDRENASLDATHFFPIKPVAVFGAGGQLGLELSEKLSHSKSYRRSEIDIVDESALATLPWQEYDFVINAAAYTEVDGAEGREGRTAAWASNATGVSNVARFCNEFDLALVHLSSDYVFDGLKSGLYDETDSVNPVGVYGQTKAAGDLAAACARRHYIIRPSWVIGPGKNFVRTMFHLARRGDQVRVVGDQVGRLTFTQDLVLAIQHLVTTRAPYGTYNFSNSGSIVSWAEIAREVYRLVGAKESLVTSVSSAEYFADKPDAAFRPENSALNLEKIESTGFTPVDWRVRLSAYVETLVRVA